MDVLPFGTLMIGECFCVDARLAPRAMAEHLLRKVDGLHAEYLDGSGKVLVPEGILVRNLEPPSEAQRAG